MITIDNRSTSFLLQSISMEVQKGKCASVLGTVQWRVSKYLRKIVALIRN